jgi:hypothetical protein
MVHRNDQGTQYQLCESPIGRGLLAVNRKACHLFIREPDCACGDVLGEVLRITGTRDDQHMSALLQRPGQSDLGGRRAVRACDRKDVCAIGSGCAGLTSFTGDAECD